MRPSGDDLGYLIIRHLLMHEREILRLDLRLLLLKLSLQLGELAVLELCRRI